MGKHNLFTNSCELFCTELYFVTFAEVISLLLVLLKQFEFIDYSIMMKYNEISMREKVIHVGTYFQYVTY